MKIAFINIYQGAVERGAEVFVTELSSRLSRKHKVKVYGLAKSSWARWPFLWRSYLDPHGIQTFIYTLLLIPGLLRERHDIVIPVNGGWQPALVRFVTWIYGGKMIISGQSGIGWDDRNNLWCFPDCFVALSKTAGKWAKRVNPFVRVEVIANGVDYKKYTDEGDKKRYNLEKPVILCVGALTAGKRQDLAIRAVAKLKKGSLLLVGKGEDEKKLKDIGKRLLGRRFMITSYPHQDMAKVYKSADLFTYPTNPSESFGIVLIEAMASGLSVVTTNDPIRKEIIGDAGIPTEVEDTGKYSLDLQKAIDIDWDEKPTNQAKQFDWEIIKVKYERLFNDLNK